MTPLYWALPWRSYLRERFASNNLMAAVFIGSFILLRKATSRQLITNCDSKSTSPNEQPYEIPIPRRVPNLQVSIYKEVEPFSLLNRTRIFITMIRRACHWPYFVPYTIQPTHKILKFISLYSILTFRHHASYI